VAVSLFRYVQETPAIMCSRRHSSGHTSFLGAFPEHANHVLGVHRHREMTYHLRLRAGRSPPDRQAEISTANGAEVRSQIQVGITTVAENLVAEMTAHTALLVRLHAGDGSSRVEMKLITDQAGAGDGDVVLSSHRAVHTRWGDFSKGPFSSKLIYHNKRGLAANITVNQQQ